MKIGLGTESPIKVRALNKALEALGLQSEVLTMKTETEVSDQPFYFEETYKGALNRATQVLENTSADVAIGLESGLMYITADERWYDMASVVVKTREGVLTSTWSSGYWIPTQLVEQVKSRGVELGVIIQELAGGGEKDPLKYLAQDKLKREDVLALAIQTALVQALGYKKLEQ